MTRGTHLFAILALSGIAVPSVLGASPRADDDRFLMLDRALRPTLVSVSSIGPAGVKLTDEQGEVREVPSDDVAALVPGWWRPGTEGSEIAWLDFEPGIRRSPPATTGILLLTDGRRVVGRLAPDASGERIAWDHTRLGRSVFALDDVRRIQVLTLGDETQRPTARAAGDRVVMTNADVVMGFVESVGNVVKVESDGKDLEFSLRQVAAIDLMNPARPPSGARLWLGDGSVVGVKGFAAPEAPGELRLQMNSAASADAATAVLPLADAVAIVPDAARVVPLAALPIGAQRGVGERRYVQPLALRWRGVTLDDAWRDSVSPGDPVPPLDAPDIELPGPMSVEWTLPPGTSRIAGWAEIPGESRMWAEFTLLVEGIGGMRGVASEGKVVMLVSESMSGTRPVVEFNFEIPRPAPERVRFTVDPGTRGPIQDRVVLRRTLLLVDPPAPPGPGNTRRSIP